MPSAYVLLGTMLAFVAVVLVGCAAPTATNMTPGQSGDRMAASQDWCILKFTTDSGLSPAGLILPRSDGDEDLKEVLFFRSDGELVTRIGQITGKGGRIVGASASEAGVEWLMPLSSFVREGGQADPVAMDRSEVASKGWILYRFQRLGAAKPMLAVPELNRAAPLHVLVARSVFVSDATNVARVLRTSDHAGMRYANRQDIQRWRAIGGGDIFEVD